MDNTVHSLFLKTIVFLKVSFLKMVVFKTIIFIKLVVSLTIVNDDPSLTIVMEERKPTYRVSVDLHLSSF